MRALPGPMIDLIRDGVRPADLRARGGAAVWAALVSTASSALQRDWEYATWAGEVVSARSQLGRQLAVDRGRELSAVKIEKQLTKAWTAAKSWLAEQPAAYTRKEAADRAEQIRTRLGAFDAACDLDPGWLAVLTIAATVGVEHGTDRPALPRQMLIDQTLLTRRKLEAVLRGLEETGLLALAVPGRPSGDPTRRRANLYRLPTLEALDAYLTRKRVYGTNQQVYGTPRTGPLWDSTSSMGQRVRDTPPAPDPVELTVRAASVEDLPRVLELLAGAGVEVEQVAAERRAAS